MKRVSVAEAKNHLPALIHDAEKAPIEIVRRGKPVAVLVSTAEFERMEAGSGEDFMTKVRRFRQTHKKELAEFGDELADYLNGLRDKSPGRKVRL